MIQRTKQIIYVLVGLTATGLALLGVVTPGLPTTIFLIIALWAFSRSSTRLHNWLLNTPVFGKAMKAVDLYHERKAIPRRIKFVAQGFAWGSFLLMLILFGSSRPLVWILVGLAAISCSIAMWWIPTWQETTELKI